MISKLFNVFVFLLLWSQIIISQVTYTTSPSEGSFQICPSSNMTSFCPSNPTTYFGSTVRLRVVNINGSQVTVRFAKCDGSSFFTSEAFSVKDISIDLYQLKNIFEIN